MARQNCKEHIVSVHGLTDEEADAVISELESVRASLPPGRQASVELKRRAKTRAAQEIENARNSEWRALKDAERFEIEADRVFGTEGNKQKSLEAWLGGNPTLSNKRRSGSENYSVEAVAKGEMAQQVGQLNLALQRELPKWEKLRADKKFNREVVEEMFHLASGAGTKSVTGNENALKMANIFNTHKELQRAILADHGVMVRRLEGHVLMQKHNDVLISSAGLDEWKRQVLPLLNKERTFAGADPDGVLDDIFKELTFSATGGGNLADRLEASRALHFKDAESLLAYDAAFGSQNDFIAGVIEQYSARAYNIGIVKRMGPNPEGMLNRMIGAGVASAKDAGEGTFDRKFADILFSALTRQDAHPSNNIWGRVVDYATALQDVSKLGFATAASVTDLATVMATLQRSGVGYFTAAKSIAGDLRRLSRTPEEKAALASMGIEIDSIISSAAMRFSGVDMPMGLAHKARQTFFKLNGLEWWTRMRQGGFALAMSNHLAGQVRKSFGSLDPKLQRTFREYGIDAKGWDKIRDIEVFEGQGRKFMVPDQSLGELADKLRSMFANESTYAVPMPGIRERATVYRGLDRGTVPGGLARLIAQFKMFPITIATKMVPRTYNEGIGHLGLLMAQMTLLGYVSGAIRDTLQGKKPRNLLNREGGVDMKVLIDAMARGGSLGIYGDLITQDFSEYGKSLGGALAGPTFKTVGDALGISQGAAKDLFENGSHADWGKHGAKAVRLAASNTPFANLFYTKAAGDYLITHNLQEWLNPGYLNRMKRLLRREGREFFIPPTGL
jgi:hypothetical protein